ncbi:MAG TPA: alpha/beta fold hydrolase [Myxococcota bacterium]|nr:alpha/beta fold hydrolase [Myxococcota bacterium]HRY95367.1 alpha/beta fold hydrolase [Myxococcota bacterium]HSA22494.1 alpha/beta fold hydrolase [Myxococcota bacterium]
MNATAVAGSARELLDRRRRFAEATCLRRAPAPAWTTPNRVALEHPAYRVRDFSTGPAGQRGPLLVVPPEVNHSAICDFAPGQSLVAAALRAGFGRVLAVEWRSATPETAGRDIDDSILTILEALALCGGPAHLVGLCQGGWESAIVTALRPERVRSLTLAAAPIDFHAGLGLIQALARGLPMATYRGLVELGGGVMRGQLISQGFDNLLPFERHFLKYLSVWNHLDEEDWLGRFHQMNDWYRAQKDLPGPMYLRAVRELFKENRLVQGRLTVLGEAVDLGRIACPLALVAGRRDHITPPPQVWAAAEHAASSRVLRREIDAGHVGTFMGRQAISAHWPEILAWLGRDGEEA